MIYTCSTHWHVKFDTMYTPPANASPNTDFNDPVYSVSHPLQAVQLIMYSPPVVNMDK